MVLKNNGWTIFSKYEYCSLSFDVAVRFFRFFEKAERNDTRCFAISVKRYSQLSRSLNISRSKAFSNPGETSKHIWLHTKKSDRLLEKLTIVRPWDFIRQPNISKDQAGEKISTFVKPKSSWCRNWRYYTGVSLFSPSHQGGLEPTAYWTLCLPFSLLRRYASLAVWSNVTSTTSSLQSYQPSYVCDIGNRLLISPTTPKAFSRSISISIRILMGKQRRRVHVQSDPTFWLSQHNRR